MAKEEIEKQKSEKWIPAYAGMTQRQVNIMAMTITEKILARLLELNHTLSSVYVLKDQFKVLYYYGDRERVKQALDDWCTMAAQIDHPTVRAFARQWRYFE